MTRLKQLVIGHHKQAKDICTKTFSCNSTTKNVQELKKVGGKFTTRVEKRLRKMESGA